MVPEPKWTKTEHKFLALLSDGMPHDVKKLEALLTKSQSDRRNAVRQTVYQLRQKLHRIGHDIISTRLNRRLHYRHVIMLYNPYDGTT